MTKRPTVFLASTYKPDFLTAMRARGWGRVWTRDRPQILPNEPWGWDNGAFVYWRRGEPFDEGAFWKRYERDVECGTPAWAVLPDIVAGAEESLALSLRFLERLDDRWPWYLAVQDGLRPEHVAPFAADIAGIFIGGTDMYKATTPTWVQWAHPLGLPVHFGRASSPLRFQFAEECGVDSVDTTAPIFTAEKFYFFVDCYDRGHPQGRLL